ncbi:MAG: hypothetical protein K8U57_40450 [Planctomycetes bacterium]|nr:hypothetical protein [Planctomycetota bacterium]
MTDDNPEPQLPTGTMSRYACVWFFVGCSVAGLVGVGLALWAAFAQAPVWILPVAFLGPPVAFVLICGSFALPRAIRAAREAVRNAPSPESEAAAAAGAGVEAGTKAESTPIEERGEFPTVEVEETQPGKVLPHSILRTGVPPGCQLGCIAVIAVIWNSVVSGFVLPILARWNRGQVVQWVEVLFLTPFVLIGLVLIGATLYAALNWIVSLLVGRVAVELSNHPIAIGATVRIQLAQYGLVPLARVKVRLICTEEATYVAGTSQSTAKREVVTKLISDPDEAPTGGGLPLAAEFIVPPDAMHSFSAPNNKIKWTVCVTGRVLGLLPFRNDFNVTVSPGAL